VLLFDANHYLCSNAHTHSVHSYNRWSIIIIIITGIINEHTSTGAEETYTE